MHSRSLLLVILVTGVSSLQVTAQERRPPPPPRPEPARPASPGVFYEPADGGYKVVAPPLGAVVPSLPPDNVQVQVGDDPYFYYGGVFYIQVDNGYQIVRAPAGAVVYNLPDGATTLNADGITYLQYNGDYYQPIQDGNGQAAYEVVEIEAPDSNN